MVEVHFGIIYRVSNKEILMIILIIDVEIIIQEHISIR